MVMLRIIKVDGLLKDIIMDLLTPGLSLLMWQLAIGAVTGLAIISWIILLSTNKLDPRDRLSWLIGTLLLPILGPLLFLIKYTNSTKDLK